MLCEGTGYFDSALSTELLDEKCGAAGCRAWAWPTVLAGVLVERRSSTGDVIHRVGVCPLREARLGLRRVLHRQTARHVHAADIHVWVQSS